MLIDEDDLRTGLRALAAAPPPQPADRVESSVRRAGTIRRRRAATVSLAVLGPAVALGALALIPAGDAGPAPLAKWPDRRDPALVATSEVALGEWLDRSRTPLGPDRRVRWLYAGRVPGADGVVVAFATCGPVGCDRVVGMLGPADATPDGDPNSSEWLMDSRDLDPAAPPAPYTTYLDGPRASNGPTNVVFVLAGPDAARVTWESPARMPGTGGSGELARAGGAFAANVGYLSAQATVTVYDGAGVVVHRGQVAGADRVPSARLLDGDLDPGPGWDVFTSMSGQLSYQDDFEDTTVDRPYAVFVRCLGPGPMAVVLDGEETDATCDGRVRRVTPVRPAPRDGVTTRLTAYDPFTVYEVAFAERR